MNDTQKNEEDKGDDILKRMLNMPPDPKPPPRPKPGKEKGTKVGSKDR